MITTLIAETEAEERDLLLEFWSLVEADQLGARLITFNGRRYDVPLLIQRSRLLLVTVPALELGKYRQGSVLDLYDVLTFNDDAGQAVMRRRLPSFCRRFGMTLPEDPVDGSQIGALVDAGDWAAVMHHNACDVEMTAWLAQRLGYTSGIVVDLETVAIDNAADFMDDVAAPRNLKDPEKIAAAIAEKKAKAALDINLARIVACSWTVLQAPAVEAGPRTVTTEAEVF